MHNKFMRFIQSTSTTNLMTTCINIGAGIALARILGPTDRGLLAAVTTWAPFFGVLFILGIHDWLTLNYKLRLDPKKAQERYTECLKWGAALGILGLGACALAYPVLLSQQQNQYSELFLIYIFYIPLHMMLTLAQHAATAGNDILAFNYSRIFQAVAHLLSVTIILCFFENPLKLLVFEHMLILLVPIFFLIRNSPPLWAKFLKPLDFNVVKASLLLHPSYLFATISLLLDRILSVYFLSNYEIGLYQIAFTIASSLSAIFGFTYLTLGLPQAANIENDKKKLFHIVAVIQQISILSLGCALLFLPFSSFFISIVFGENFVPATQATNYLLIAYALIYIKITATRSIKALNLAHMSNAVEILYFVAMTSISVVLWNTGELTIVTLAQANLVSVTLSLSLFFIIFIRKFDLKTHELFNIDLALTDFRRKVKSVFTRY